MNVAFKIDVRLASLMDQELRWRSMRRLRLRSTCP